MRPLLGGNTVGRVSLLVWRPEASDHGSFEKGAGSMKEWFAKPADISRGALLGYQISWVCICIVFVLAVWDAVA